MVPRASGGEGRERGRGGQGRGRQGKAREGMGWDGMEPLQQSNQKVRSRFLGFDAPKFRGWGPSFFRRTVSRQTPKKVKQKSGANLAVATEKNCAFD